MRPYGVEMSHRPGCPCCNSKHLHKHRPKGGTTQAAKYVKRSAKKAERSRARIGLTSHIEED